MYKYGVDGEEERLTFMALSIKQTCVSILDRSAWRKVVFKGCVERKTWENWLARGIGMLQPEDNLIVISTHFWKDCS